MKKQTLEPKNIVLGVASSIAAYKAVYLARLFVKNGFNVRVIQTKNSHNLINPLLFQYITSNPVNTETFFKGDFGVNHISLTDWADCFIVAPATYNVIGKLAAGIADDLLTTVLAAFKKQIFICPAMNTAMWDNPINKGNLEKLSALHNIEIINPADKALLCGTKGEGALADEEFIYLKTVNYLKYKNDMKGYKILISGGGTLEYIDDVRVITNLSSGLQASLLAENAFFRGADVLLVGANLKEKSRYVNCVEVKTSAELYKELNKNIENFDFYISAAAISDFIPETPKKGKIKSGASISLNLKKNVDIFKKIKENHKRLKTVAFALETENLIKNAFVKLKNKKADLIAANKISAIGNKETDACIISEKGVIYRNIKTKEKLAEYIIESLRTLK